MWDRLFYNIGGADKTWYINKQIFVTLDEYTRNIKVYLLGLVRMFDAEFTGSLLLSPVNIYYFFRLMIIIAGVRLSISHILRFIMGKDCDDKDVFMAMSTMFVSLACIITSVLYDMQIMRYYGFIPFFYGAMLIRAVDRLDGNRISSASFKRAVRYAVITVAVVVTLWGVVRNVNVGAVYDEGQYRLMRDLKEAGLKSGYAQYWDSSRGTLYSDGAITLRAIAYAVSGENGNGAVMPYMWFCKDDWYREYADFIVLGSSRGEDLLSYDVVVKQFGEPERVFKSGIYTVLCYDRDLSGELVWDLGNVDDGR